MNSPDERNPNGNGNRKLVASLLSSEDRAVKLVTLGLVALSGIGNWLATSDNAQTNRTEIDRARQQLNEIYQNQKSFPKLEGLEPAVQTNADHIAVLTKRIEQLEKQVDESMTALQDLVNESKAAANQAADISRDTRKAVKETPRTRTVIQKTQKIQRVQKVYKIF